MKILLRVVLLLLLGMPGVQGFAEERTIVVVIDSDNPVSSITKSQLIDLYMGRYVAFPDGSKAQPVDLDSDHVIKNDFYRKLIGMSLARVNSYWSKIKFTGRAKPPMQVRSESDAIDFLTEHTHGIAYIRSDQLKDNLKVIYTFDE